MMNEHVNIFWFYIHVVSSTYVQLSSVWIRPSVYSFVNLRSLPGTRLHLRTTNALCHKAMDIMFVQHSYYPMMVSKSKLVAARLYVYAFVHSTLFL
jgi:hypothetical protein